MVMKTEFQLIVLYGVATETGKQREAQQSKRLNTENIWNRSLATQKKKKKKIDENRHTVQTTCFSFIFVRN